MTPDGNDGAVPNYCTLCGQRLYTETEVTPLGPAFDAMTGAPLPRGREVNRRRRCPLWQLVVADDLTGCEVGNGHTDYRFAPVREPA